MSYQAEVLADSPVAYWPLKGASGSNEVDLVNGVVAAVNGTIGGKTLRYPNSGGRDFSGTASYFFVSAADMGNIYWNGGDYSAEWFAQADSVGQDGIFSQRTSAQAVLDQGLSIFGGPSGAGVMAVDMGASGTRSGLNNYTFVTGQYQHFVFTYEDATKTRRLYVDGMLAGFNIGANVTVPVSVPPMSIGILGGNVSYAWDGVITHLSLYRKRLTEADVKRHYLASGAKGMNVSIAGNIVRKPVRRLAGSVLEYVSVK